MSIWFIVDSQIELVGYYSFSDLITDLAEAPYRLISDVNQSLTFYPSVQLYIAHQYRESAKIGLFL